MLKHALQYLLFALTMFAVDPAAGGGGGGGNSNTGAGTGTGTGQGSAGGSGASGDGSGGGASGNGSTGQPGQGAGAAQPGASGDQGLKQLREAYEGVKAKFEPFEKLNLKPEQIGQYSGVYQKVYNEAAAVGRELGYPDDQIAEALAEDPVRTIDFLRNEAAKAAENRQQPNGREDLTELVNKQLEQVLGPIQQRENVRMTDAANNLFIQTTRQLAVDSFRAEGIDVANIPADEMEFLMTATSEILKYDESALKALKYEGKTAPIQKAFQEARTALDKYYLARSTREKARLAPPNRGGQQQPPPGQNGGKRPTLDEMIENPGLIGAKYA
jgi:hypothetical protein